MRSYPSCWTKTLSKLGFRRSSKRTHSQKQRGLHRRAFFEPLEHRQLLAADLYTVTTVSDVAVEGTTTDNLWSLREAIDHSAADSEAGTDTILFDASLEGETIALNSSLTLSSDVEIFGPGADKLTIDGQGNDRVISVANGGELLLHGLTLAGGDAGTGNGGAITNSGDLTLNLVMITNNHADSNSGGAIFNSGSATLSVRGSTFEQNTAKRGGAIAFASNSTEGLTIDRSSFIDNQVSVIGGAIYLSGSSTQVAISNSTFSGNHADKWAGAIQVYGQTNTLEVLNSTISSNDANLAVGGLRNSSTGTVTVHNTILAGNLSANTSTVDASGDISGTAAVPSTNNLIGVGNAAHGISDAVDGNQVGTSAAPLDPLLAPLADYNGTTKTHALLEGSPALDAGNDAMAGSFDQRLHTRPFDLAGVGNEGSNVSDIGAFEAGNPTILEAQTLDDENDVGELANSSDMSLREALSISAELAGAEVITFDKSMSGQTIHLSSALEITSAITIDGSDLLDPLILDGGHGLDGVPATGDGDRLITIDDGTPQEIEVTIRNAVLEGGDLGSVASGSLGGGAIYNRENLTIEDSTIARNAVAWNGANYEPEFLGGGIMSTATLTINRSVVTQNQASVNAALNPDPLRAKGGFVEGGGIYGFGTLTINESKITGNRAQSISQKEVWRDSFVKGGGIFADGDVSIRASTIDGNVAQAINSGLARDTSAEGLHDVRGGGIYLADRTDSGGAAPDIVDSTISNNVARSSFISPVAVQSELVQGGGISFTTGFNALEILNSTISGNTAAMYYADNTTPDYAPVYLNGGGLAGAGRASFMHSTIADNHVDGTFLGDLSHTIDGGGIGIGSTSTSADVIVTLDHTIVANNTLFEEGEQFAPAPNDVGAGVSAIGSYSIVEDGSVTGPTVLNVDPYLGPLVNNGGITETHALLPASPALDAGDPNIMGEPEFDQRGNPHDRIAEGDEPAGPNTMAVIDIGAYEEQIYQAHDEIPGVETDSLMNAQMVTLDTLVESPAKKAIRGNLDPSIGDTSDYYKFNLRAGDILGVSVVGTDLGTVGWNLKLIDDKDDNKILDPATELRMESEFNAAGIYPVDSPLPGGDAALAQVIEEDGLYYLEVTGGQGEYWLHLDAFRPVLEQEEVGTSQILYLDFDGETFDAESIFGPTFLPEVMLSPLSDFLGPGDAANPYGWDIGAAAEEQLIDAIVANVFDNLDTEIREPSNNTDNFDIQIFNSWDHPNFDFESTPHASRVIVGGTREEFGDDTVGIAQSIDVGNFDTTETAVVLLDLLASTDTTDPLYEVFSINSFTPGGLETWIDLIAEGVGNVIAHEASHIFGNFHTDSDHNGTNNLADKGSAELSGLLGIPGPPGPTNKIWSGEDNGFGVDIYSTEEPFNGYQDTLNTIAFGLTGGTAPPTGNEPPIITIPSPLTTPEDTPLVFSDAGNFSIDVSDVDGGTIYMQVVGFTPSSSFGDTSGLTIYDQTGSYFFASGTAEAWDAAFDGFTYVPPTDFVGVDRITLVVEEGDNEFEEIFDITMTQVNDAPIITIPSPLTTPEDTPLVFSDAGNFSIDVSDVDGGTIYMQVVGFTPSSSFGDTSGLTIYDQTGSYFFASGTAEAWDAAFDGFTYVPPTDFVGVDRITLVVEEGDNEFEEIFDITMTQVNDAPIITIPSPLTTPEDTPLVFSDAGNFSIDVSDVDGGTIYMQVVGFTPSSSFGDTSGLTIYDQTGSYFFASGTAEAWDAAFDGFTYVPPTDFVGVDRITLVVEEGDNEFEEIFDISVV